MLTERQKLILNAIIDDYIHSAEPVGSRSISKRGDIGFSPATIRNEMSDIEELGLLEQPHTSAGRIPSEKGYRYYVDHLVQRSDLTHQEVDRVRAFFADRMIQAENMIEEAANILSSLTKYTAVVLGPEMFQTTLRHFQIVPLSPTTVVAIIVTSTGHVENRLINLEKGMSGSDLEKIVNLLNQRLTGVPFHLLRSRLYNEVASELSNHVRQFEQAFQIVEQALEPANMERVIVGGTTKIFDQPEFRNVEQAKHLLDLFDDTSSLLHLMRTPSHGVDIRIGSETGNKALANCSLITAAYTMAGKPVGTIGLIGPTRMSYGRVIGLLEFIASELSRRIEHLSGDT